MDIREIAKQFRFPRTALLSVLVWGTFLICNFDYKRPIEIGSSQALSQNSPPDTTAPIEDKSCNSYGWFRDQTREYWKSEDYGPLPGTYVASLHELTCKWAAYQRGLSFGSTRLPKYVRPMGDSLQLGEEVLAYGVKMVELGASLPNNELYFVAEVADSLFYREIQEERPGRRPSKISVRALRELGVPGAESQYIWFETNYYGEDEIDGVKWTTRRWRGYVFTYDKRRGMRYLQHVPIRLEREKEGQFHGVRQLDVSIPEPGVMVVKERLQRGAKVTRGMGWHQWLGPHVIDTSATDNESFRDPRQ